MRGFFFQCLPCMAWGGLHLSLIQGGDMLMLSRKLDKGFEDPRDGGL